jgi:hypothetical protein
MLNIHPAMPDPKSTVLHLDGKGMNATATYEDRPAIVHRDALGEAQWPAKFCNTRGKVGLPS